MIRKLSLLSLMAVLSISANGLETVNLNEMDWDSSTVIVPKGRALGLEEGTLKFDQEGFFVEEEDGITRVHSYDTDKVFRNRGQKDVLRFAMQNKFKVKRFDNGEYKVEAAGGLKGGGVLGAWGGMLLGKGLVHFVGHGTILIVSACTGPAAPATFAALEAALLPTVIEPMSNVAAIGMGVAGGVATGPV